MSRHDDKVEELKRALQELDGRPEDAPHAKPETDDALEVTLVGLTNGWGCARCPNCGTFLRSTRQTLTWSLSELHTLFHKMPLAPVCKGCGRRLKMNR